MNTARKILGNTAIQIFGKIVTAAVSIFIIKLITGYLGRAGYGEYTTIYEFLAFFAIAADFGIFQIAVREMSRAAESKRAEIFGNILALRAVLVLVSMAVAIGVVFLIPKYAGTAIPFGVAIASVTTLLTIIFGTLSALLQVALRMHWSVVAIVAGKLITLGWMIFVVQFWLPDDPHAGFFQLLVAGIVGGVIALILTFVAARKVAHISLRFDWQFWKTTIVQTLPYGAAILLATVYFRIDIILLSLLRTSEEVGVYGVSARILESLQMIPIFFLNSTLGVMTRLFHDNREKLRRLLQHAFDFLLLIGLPIAVGGSVLAFPLIAAVSSPEFVSDPASGFVGSDVALQILLPAMLFTFFGHLFGYTLLAGGRQAKLLWVSSSVALFNLIGNLLVIPVWGFVGAAATSVVSQMLVFALSFWFVRRMIRFRFTLTFAVKAGFAASVMGAAVWWLEPRFFDFFGGNVGLLALIPLGGAIYGGVLVFTRAITPEMWQLVKK